MVTKKQSEVERMSFQAPGRRSAILFLHLNEAGTIEFRAEDFRGKVLENALNPVTSFESWVKWYIGKVLDELEAE